MTLRSIFSSLSFARSPCLNLLFHGKSISSSPHTHSLTCVELANEREAKFRRAIFLAECGKWTAWRDTLLSIRVKRCEKSAWNYLGRVVLLKWLTGLTTRHFSQNNSIFSKKMGVIFNPKNGSKMLYWGKVASKSFSLSLQCKVCLYLNRARKQKNSYRWEEKQP